MAKIQDTIIFTRKDLDTLWPGQAGTLYEDATKEIREHMKALSDSEKRVRKSGQVSEDGFTQTFVIEYESEATRTEHFKEEIVIKMREFRDSYCNENDITITETTKEI